ncbi:hypothetical protein [Natrarchaeobaculum aegyptiacum]|uniref:Uncharacterized protein n=1 Tax=Natrarchaeobaculum aegyptiacum TaxID=745377 RepID=A0A2Z2HRD4_9EURY|nr:hypothetical protein [Natrarchaeobaculum aegyptiacum]ARS89323.1 hypothetical protein B1756_05895 [Natrarchaeobaculum aegyptiacum]
MTDQKTTTSLDDLTAELETAIEDLESTETEISALSGWTETASADLEAMNAQDRAAVKKQASELKGQLRILDTPEDLIEFGEQFKDSFSKPVEQSALRGLEETVDILEIELPRSRIDELRESVRSRTPSDLQEDAQGYQHAVTMLQDETNFTVNLISSRVDTDSSRYLISPTRELTPLIGNIKNRREALENLEEIFASAGEWVPDGLCTLQETESYYSDPDSTVAIESIKTEIEAIDEAVNNIEISIGVVAVVENDVEARLDGVALSEFQSELNTVATKLGTFSANVEDTLLEIDSVTSMASVPDSLRSASVNLSTELEEFHSGKYNSVGELLGAASTVEKEYENFVDKIVAELEMLDTMCSQIAEGNNTQDLESPVPSESLSGFKRTAIREHPEKAFETITEYREWVDTAFDDLSDEFTGKEVSELFERLHTEDTILLSSVDFDALRELRETVPIVIQLQQ